MFHARLLGLGFVVFACPIVRADESAWLHWPMAEPPRGATTHGVKFTRDGAVFEGRSHLSAAGPRFGKGEFTLSAWVKSDGDAVGDLVSQYDAARRRGFHWSIKSNSVTTTQANRRQMQFGIDDGSKMEWVERGRPGNAVLAFALAVFDGSLFAGTCEPGKDESGRVYRLRDNKNWEPCGSPDSSNAVTALAVLDGKLYAATGKYRLAGSSLAESANTNLGGQVFRYEGGSTWVFCGRLPNVEAIGGLVVFRGKLYASSLYKPAGFFRYEGAMSWTSLPVPNGKRVEAMAVYRDRLYATGYDEGHVYRYDGESWTDLGKLGDNTQTYSFAIHEDRLMVGTWPSGRVYRFEEPNRWTDTGRLGEELEVMGMVVHNGRLLAGTLPLAEVHEFERDDKWNRLAQLDATPNVRYRRAWTAAEHRGQVFFSTLPSGKVYSAMAGVMVTWDREFPHGWHHVAAVRSAKRLQLFIDGRTVADSACNGEFDLTSDQPLRVGSGPAESFHGTLRDLRIHTRALTGPEIEALAKARPQ